MSRRSDMRRRIKGIRSDASHYRRAVEIQQAHAMNATCEKHREDALAAAAYYHRKAQERSDEAHKLEDKYDL